MNKTQQKIYTQAKEKWDAIAKPIDSLGVFEDMVARLCAIAGTVNPGDYKRRALLTLCADHGVVAEGVTQTDSGVTKVVAENIAHGCSGVNYMAKTAGVDVYAVDIGMLSKPYPDAAFGMGHMINRKVQAGTRNLAKEPAMSTEVCDRAIEEGKELPFDLKDQVIYYVGPTPTKPGHVFGSGGPTTSGRMDAYAPKMLSLGLHSMIGKGYRNPAVKEAIKYYCGIYFGAIGGAGAYIGKCVKSSTIIAFDDLGAEAIRKLEVIDFPLTVIIDCYGEDLYEMGRSQYLSTIK